MKLLLARIATALFWFNPLVWVLAREAHQLREEAADDSVLAADILDTDHVSPLTVQRLSLLTTLPTPPSGSY